MAANQSSAPSGSEVIETFSYDDSIVRMFVTATILWGVVGTLAGLVVAILLVQPYLFDGVQWVSFGRLRPLHTNTAIFAFAGNAIFAAIYFSTQRLCKARMWSKALSQLHFWGWQMIIVAGAATLPLGMTQGKEYAEFEWPIDIAIAVVWILIFGVNFLMTLVKRRERHMYVALWFYIATIVTVALPFILNNLVLPWGKADSYSIYAGVQDALMQWWYGHNVIAFLMTIPFLGLMYYFLPKAAERPVFSYKLSIVHFWSLIIIYVWAGPHHLHYTALPEWASTLGMLFGIMLWMPSWGGMINGLLTLRGAWHKVAADPILKFYVVGLVFYGWSTIEGPMLSVKSINALTHYSDWTIAHVHAGALGWNGFMTFGMIYWLLPRIFQTKLHSTKLMSLHFWIGTIAILLYIIPIYAAGLIQGLMWRSINPETGQLTYDFIETTQTSVSFWWIRVGAGALYAFGTLLLAYNTLLTWLSRPARYEVPTHLAPKFSAQYADAPTPKSSLEGAPVLGFGIALDAWAKLAWHRTWERLPGKFVGLVAIAVVVAAVFELIPTFFIRGNIPTSPAAAPYTPLELAGREIYISEGCYNCHSQQIRPLVAETKRYGEYSLPGEFVFDHPFQWGSRRIGPDLAREGTRRTHQWHWSHLDRPDAVSEGSVMPAFPHLLEQDLNYSNLAKIVKTAHLLGADYPEQILSDPAGHARKQAIRINAEMVAQGGEANVYEKQAIALIAYLQRLGIDKNRTPPPAKRTTSSVATTSPTKSASADVPATESSNTLDSVVNK